jgi:hypothetical protein
MQARYRGLQMRRSMIFLMPMTLCGAAWAQPVPAAIHTVDAAAAPVTAYPGTMTIVVDATDIERRIFWIKQTIPVAKPG